MKTTHTERQAAFGAAFDAIDRASLSARARQDGPPEEEYQHQRYLALRDDPRKLLRFVRETIGERSPETTVRAAQAYLREMEGRYAK